MRARERLLFAPSCLFVHGRVKVVERSVKKTPDWILQMPADCLLVEGHGSTLKDARQGAEQDLLRQVVNGIAVNVRSESTAEAGKNGDGEWDNFLSRVSVRGAELPFLSDITLAKSEDSYWEKVVDSATGEESFRLFFLYPFGPGLRKKLIEEYADYDRGREDKLNYLEQRYGKVESLDELLSSESELELLSGWFPDSRRAARAESLLGQFRQIRRSLVIVGELERKGECRVMVRRGAMTFNVPGLLDVKSNCASGIKVIPEANGWSVTFNTDDCLASEENYLTFILHSGTLNLKGRMNF